jgi:spermidine synthase
LSAELKQHFHSIALALFFLSGFTGLCYEICWIRSAGQIFGSTNFAVSSVVALFFTGMALGSHYFGSRSKKYLQPLKVYALLEIGIGLFAASSLYLQSIFEIPYHLLYPAYFQNSIVISTIQLLLIALVIIPPTFLMGGTLPLFTEFYEATGSSTSDRLALLYAVNTIGAAFGCLVCGFLLLPLLGVRTTLMVIGILAISCGTYILYALKKENHCPVNEASVVIEEHTESIHFTDPAERALLYAIIFGTGFCALSYEILWTRFLSLITHNTVYTYTISLLTALIGIAIGSYLSHSRSKDDNHVVTLGAVQIVSAIFVLLSFFRPTSMWEWAASSDSPFVVLMTCTNLMLIPSLLSGLSFPLLFDFIRHTDFNTGSRVGRALTINTVGCVSGSMLTGFVLLPFLGMHVTLVITTYLCLMLGIFALVFLDRNLSRRNKAIATVASLSAWGCLIYATDVRLPQDYLAKGKTLIDYVEGKNSFISVTRKNDDIEMEMDRMWQGQKSKGHQIMAAHLPMLLHPSAKDILVVGVGAGQAPGRFLYYDIARLDCVDLESKIPEVLKKHFSADWLNDPRTHFIVDDGNNYLRNIDRKYDLISVEVGQIFRPQVSTFYNVEFYRNARKRLAQDGIISQFLPVGFFTEEQLKSVIKTFITEFPHSTLWYNRYSELILVGSPNRDLAIRKDGVAELRKNKQVVADLFFGYPGAEEHFLNKPEVLAASFLMGPEGLEKISAAAPLLSDDKPILEYGTARTSFSPQRFKKIFEEQHESPRQIIGFADPEPIMGKVTRVQHHYIENSFK